MTSSVIRGVELDHDRSGTGPTMVWGHGLTSSRGDEGVAPVLVDWERARTRLDVIRYDARGHGRSGFTPEPEPYGWDQMAIDQLELLDTIGVDRCVVGGASMGAATALHTAVRSPHRVRALVLVIPPTAWATRSAQADNYRRMADLVESGRLDDVLAAGRQIPPPDPFVEFEGWHDRSAARLRAFEPGRLAGLFRGAATADLPPPEWITTIDRPTLILAWTGDPAHPADTANQLDELIGPATLHLASTADEVGTWTDRLVDFVTGLD